MTRGYVLLTVLMLAVVACGVSTVYLKHESRRLFVELRGLQKLEDQMQIEWGQLQLEQSTWATHDRIRTVAGDALNLYMPPGDAVVLVHAK